MSLKLEAGSGRMGDGRSAVDVVSVRICLVNVGRHHQYTATGRHHNYSATGRYKHHSSIIDRGAEFIPSGRQKAW